MPRPKLCGCCLSSTALTELADLQIPAGKLRPVPLNAVCVAAAGGSAWISMEGSACLSRESLDSTLVQQAIDAGAHWLPGVSVSAIDSSLGDAHAPAMGPSIGILGRFVSQPPLFVEAALTRTRHTLAGIGSRAAEPSESRPVATVQEALAHPRNAFGMSSAILAEHGNISTAMIRVLLGCLL
ncbi:MAG: hypothetical protein WCQ91_02395 [Planctomycetota bacterium]